MRRFILFLISFALFSCSTPRKYQNLPEVKAWEKDIQQFEQLDRSEKYPEDAILFMGSSSIRLWTTIKQDMLPYTVIQRGFGGSKLSDLVVYADRIVAPHPCKAIVLFVANDIVGSDQDKSPRDVAQLFNYILKIIRKTHPDTPVFWIAVTPTPSRWKVWPQVKEAGKYIEEICNKKENVNYIKTDFAFLNESGIPKEELFVADQLHLNDKGYALWTGLIKEELNKVLNR
jgi:hypothetical protein